MSKKFKNFKWDTVPLEGFPKSVTDNLQGFVGLEECKTYGLDKESKRPKKNKAQQKRKNTTGSSEIEEPNKINQKKLQKRKNTTAAPEKEVPNKKIKLSNGFTVENCIIATPSLSNAISEVTGQRNRKIKAEIVDKKPKNIVDKSESTRGLENMKRRKGKPRLGESTEEIVTNVTAEDMLSWAEFKLPDSILKALAELGFKQPTKIQQLTLPAAIHGRRDILGAAETGSGKTLAFGLPILSGILSLKAKAEAKGLDIYDIPFKKSSNKKKKGAEIKKSKILTKKSNKKGKAKESSEEGYSSGEDSEVNHSNVEDKPNKSKTNTKLKTSETKQTVNSKTNAIQNSKKKTKANSSNSVAQKTKVNSGDEYLEEIDVPIRKRSEREDTERADSDDNYIHLSDMLDSDDMADSSDESDNDESGDDKSGNDESVNEDDDHNSENDSEDEGSNLESDSESNDETRSIEEDMEDSTQIDDTIEDGTMDDDEQSGSESDDKQDSGEDMDEGVDEDIEGKGGIGCVKVIDNIEIPGHVVTKTGKPLFALILTPTRELAIQISNHLKAAAKYTGIKVATIVGGMASVKQERLLKCGPEVVVATPGRLWQLLQQGQTHLQQLDGVKFLAIDETDRMVERGHFEELEPLLERLNADDVSRGARQNFVFSATLTMVHDLPNHLRGKKVTKRGKIINRRVEKMTPEQKVKRLIKMIGMTDPKVVDITTQNLGTAETLTESMIACSFDQKDAYLFYILKQHPGRTIVFCNSIGCVKRLAQLFTILKCRPLPLHASMQQKQRLKNLERFRDDNHGVLIATDVAARGLDIPNVDHVIHYQVPRTAENYVHRSGRTARATKEGLTILMMEPAEAYLYSKLCRTLNKTSELPTFPTSSTVLSSLKQAVVLARDIDALTLQRRRSAQAQGWRERVAREMDIIVDDDVAPVKQVDPSIDKALRAKTKQLNTLLSRPLFPKGFSFKYPTLNDPNALLQSDDNALQVMKKALATGELKKQKRKSKNAPLLNLEKNFKKM